MACSNTKVQAPRDTFPVFRFAFSVFPSRKTISSIKIDGHGSTGVKLEKLKLVKPKTPAKFPVFFCVNFQNVVLSEDEVDEQFDASISDS